MANVHDKRHIAQAIDEVGDVAVSPDMGDKELVERIEANAIELRVADEDGDAEKAHEYAKKVAAMAIVYLARGLA